MSTKSLTPNNGDQLNKNTLNSEMGVSSRSSINPSSKNVKKSKGAKQQVEAIEKLSKNVLPRKRVDLDAISKALVIALTAGASVITPAVVYFKRNEEYEITMIANEALPAEAQKLTVKRGTIISVLKTQVMNAVQGHTLVGIYKDQACTIPFAETDKITKNTQVFLRYEVNKYKITLPAENDKFTITNISAADLSNVAYGDSFSFTLSSRGIYSLEDFVVYVNGEPLEYNENGMYEIASVEGDTIVEVKDVQDVTYNLTGVLPEGVYVQKLGVKVNSVRYNDVVTIHYTESEDKVMSTFTLDGKAIENGHSWKVKVDLNDDLEDVLKDIIKFEQVDACGLSFVAGEESTTITGFDKSVSDVTIPSKVYNKTITSIPAELFEGSSVVESVTIPNTITEIGAEAFNGCVKLGNITFEDGSELTTIKAGAFKNTAITSIGLPNTLTSVEKNAFEGCSQLTTVSLPSGIATITAGMFKDSGLTEIEIPSSVTTVEDGAFEGSDLQTITFAKRTEALSIGKAAFKECLSLESISLPDLTSLSDEMFAQSGLKSIEIPSSVTTIGASVFEGCNSLTEITNLDKVTSIGAKAFKECLSLESISLPALTSLSDELFAQSGLKSIEIPSGVKTIGNSVFSGCEELETINLPNSIISYGSEVLTGTIKLKRIKLAKTDGQTGKINLSILSAANYQFENSSNYIFDVLQDSVLLSEYVVPEDVTIIQDETFKNSSFESIVLQEGLKTIGANVFEGCENLQMVNIPSTVTSIGSAAFKDCVSLESIILPAKLTAISDSLFSGSGLKSIEIPSKVKTIGENAFNGLSIQSVTIPSSVTTIKNGAFDGCSTLIDVTILSDSVVENITELSSCGNLISNAKTIKVSPVVQSSSNYLTDSCYKFVSKVGEIDFYLYAHKETAGETSYTVPKEVTAISSYTFLNSDLQSINFEEGSLLTTIKEYAFSSAKIASIEIPEKVTSIENKAFIGCGNLKNVTILSSSIVEQITDLNSCGDLITNAIEVVVNKGDTNTYFDSTNYVQFESEKNDFFVRVGDRIDEEINYTQYVKFNNATYLGTETNQLHTLLYFNDISATGFEVPETTEIIVKDAFIGCSMLAEIDFSEARMLRKIGEGAFRNTALEEVYLPTTLKVLGDYAFADCANLEVLVIEENVEVINPNIISGTYCELKVAKSEVSNQGYTINNNFTESYVFENENYYLHYQKTTGNNYNVPADVTIIPASTFENASYDEVVLPEGLKIIGKNAFANSEIVRLTIPSSVTTIEEGAFNNCSYLEEVIFNGNSTAQKVMVRSLSKLSSSVSLTIGANAFSNCEILKKITFSNNITHIGDNAFQGCSTLTDVVLPEELLSIGKQAFADCVGLTNITIPAKVETISTKAFYGCVNLETVTINSETIYSNIHHLSDCGNLLVNAKEININQSFSGNEYFENKINFIKIPNGEYFAYVYVDGNIDENSEVEYTQLVTENNATYLGTAENAYHTLLYIDDKTATSAEINSLTEMIAGNAFAESSVESIIIPKFVKEIRENAFYNSKLETITFEEESVLQVVGEKSFANTKIDSIVIPETVEYINAGAFMNTDLTQIRIPKAVISIGESAFAGTNLEEVVIESESIYQAANGVNQTIAGGLLNEIARVQVVRGEEWGEITNSYLNSSSFSKLATENKEYFFADFNEEITIPSDVTVIQAGAFANNSSLQQINFGESQISIIEDNAFYNSGLISIHIPQSVTHIGLHAFENCTSLESVTFDEDVQIQNLTSYLFAGTTALKSINIPASSISLDDYIFKGSALESITFGSEGKPSQLVYIGREAFGECESLQSIIIPANVKDLVNTAFSGCVSLRNVEFEKNSIVKSLGVNLFNGLPIENIIIPASVETIQNNAFGNCTQLQTVRFESESNLREIHGNAFNGCSLLEEISIPDTVEEIGVSAFEGCSSLAKITLAEGSLTKINANAFKGTAITSLHIPASVTIIGDYAFQGTEITEITLPASLETIGAGAFDGCAITSVVIPENVTEIGMGAFTNLTSVTIKSEDIYKQLANGSLSGWLSDTAEVHVVIEDGTTAIENDAFVNCYSLKSIKIAEGVETIGTQAFAGCVGLTEIEIPASVISIGSVAFHGCSNLETIVFEDIENSQLTTIGYEAFGGTSIKSVILPDRATSLGINIFESCTNLTSVTLPSTLTAIPEGMFKNCSSLANIEMPNSVTLIGSSAFEGCLSLTSINLPDSVTSIGADAFKGTAITEITLPASLEAIGAGAFSGCAITEVVIPENVTTISEGAFTNLTSVTIKSPTIYSELKDGTHDSWIGDAEVHIVIPEGTTAIQDEMFGSISYNVATKIVSVSIPASVETIGGYTFASCKSLESVTFDENSKLTTIGGEAFNGCSSLTNINLPSTVTSIYDNAFGYTGLTSIELPAGVTKIGFSMFYECKDLASVTFLGDITEIGDYAFENCEKLTSINLPDSVTSIGADAFKGTAITEITLPASLEAIGAGAFSGCAITNVVIPENVATIGENAFTNLTSVTIVSPTIYKQLKDGTHDSWIGDAEVHIVIPEGTTEIKDDLFNMLYGLSTAKIVSVSIPASVKTIGEYAFISCSSLTTVTFAENGQLTSIGDYAFEGCSNLTSIEIPASVTEIGDMSFRDCSKLSDVKFARGSQLTTIGSEAFSRCESLTSITIPKTVTSIGPSAFLGSGLTSIELPAGVTEIGDWMFCECKDLESVTFLGDVTTIGDSAFYGCESLTSINLPDSVTSIGANAFGGTAITEITLPASLEAIGAGAFSGCAITSVVIPENVATIGENAFTGCSSLTSVTIASDEIYNGLTEEAYGGLIANATDIYIEGAAFTEAQTNPNSYLEGNYVGIKTSETIHYYKATTISANAYANRTDITRVTIPASVINIGEYAFTGCSNLQSVEFVGESNLESIGSDAFSGCSSLTEMIIPENVTTIGENAFTNLTSVTIKSEDIYTELKNGTHDNWIGEADVHVVIEDGTTAIEADLFNMRYGSSTAKIVSVSIPASVTEIGYFAFEGCSNLTSIEIPASVTEIGHMSFHYCSKLSDVKFARGSQLTTIDSEAFAWCEALTSIEIPASVTQLGVQAFGRTGLTSIEIPSGVTVINDDMFYECKDLEYVTFLGDITEIGDNAFYGCSSLTSINLPDSVTSIGANAFEGTAITEITLPASLETIGAGAFRYCSNLTTVTFRDVGNSQLTSIGDYTFQYSGITSIEIPASVETIGDYAFSYCSNLTTVTFDENSKLTTIGAEAFIRCSSLTNINLPSTVTQLGIQAFGRTGLTSIEIPSGVTVINGDMFYECKDLASVTFLGDITEIEDYAFQNCESLTSINLPDSVTSIGANAFEGTAITEITLPASLETIGAGAFSGCVITEVVIPENVTDVDVNAFTNLTSVTIKSPTIYKQLRDGIQDSWIGEADVHVVIEDGITQIETSLFACAPITSVLIPASVETIGADAFGSCSKLTSVKFAEGSKIQTIGADAFNGCSSLTSINLPDSVTTIGANAFEGTAITEITLPASLEIIEAGAFSGCAITEVVIPENVTTIGEGAFTNLTSVTIKSVDIYTELKDGKHDNWIGEADVHVVIEDGTTEIENEMFGSPDGKVATNLVSVSIPASVETIGGFAFVSCKNLESVTFDENSKLTTIGGEAFNGCSSLTNINLPSTVTSIYDNAFGYTGLTSIELPAGVTVISDYMFCECKDLESVTFLGDITEIGDYAFYGCESLTRINLPDSVTKIGDFAFKDSGITSIEIPASVETIGALAFVGCKSLESVSFAENSKLTTIGDEAFSHCESLTNINIPTTVTSIGASAFLGSGLTSINIPGSVTEISDDMFYGCKDLEYVEIIFGDTSKIGNMAFYGCEKLTSIYIPASVTSIGEYAFTDCSRLTSVTIASADIYNALTSTDACGGLIANATDIYIEGAAFEASQSTINEYLVNNYVGIKTSDTIHYNKATAISASAYANRTDITKVTIPASVTSIGARAFINCSNLEKVEFAENSQLTTIGMSAFYNSGITSIEIPENVQTIGAYSFYGCSSLTSVNLPSTLTTIGIDSFKETGLTEIEIPASVTSIQSGAFRSCSNLNSVTFEAGSKLETIGSGAFENTAITEIKIPASVKTLDGGDFSFGAFNNCSKLETVIFEENSNLQTIGNYTFAGTKITEIEIPSTVKTINKYAFSGCSSLTSVTIASEDIYNALTSTDACGGLIANATDIYLVGDAFTEAQTTVNEYLVNNYVGIKTNNSIYYYLTSEIESYAFSGRTDITAVTIPANVTLIGNGSFSGCSGLTRVTLPNSVQIIGESAFSHTGLTSITIPSNVETISVGAFEGCESLTSISIPASVTLIGDNAFIGCSSLTSVTIEELQQLGSSLKEIGSGAFNGCSSLTTIALPASLETIGENAFNSSGLTSIELPASLEIIGAYAFYSCAITEVIIPENITTIGENAFTNLTSVTIKSPTIYKQLKDGTHDSWIGDAEVHVVIEDETTEIEAELFNMSYGLSTAKIVSVSIPASVTSIGDYAFFGCSSLTTVTFAENSQLTSIGDCAFQNSGITSINIPASVETIGALAFVSCKNLESVTFAENSKLTTIGGEAFHGCSSLTNINLPSTVTSIYDNAFGYTGLTSIELPSGVTVINGDMFYECKDLASVTFLGDITEIGERAFQNCEKLTSINLPDSVTSIGASAFENCSSLSGNLILTNKIVGQKAFMNSGITNVSYSYYDMGNIGSYAFAGTQVTSLNIPFAPAYGFAGCEQLTSVTIEIYDSEQAVIGSHAFEGCSNLATLKLPNEFNGIDGYNNQSYEIYDYAFDGCTSLKSIEISAACSYISATAFVGSGLTTVNGPEAEGFDQEIVALYEYYSNNNIYLVETSTGNQTALVTASSNSDSPYTVDFYNGTDLATKLKSGNYEIR